MSFDSINRKIGGKLDKSGGSVSGDLVVDKSITASSVSSGSIQVTGSIQVNGADLVPVGSVFAYAGSTAPTNYLLCDGSAVSRTVYSALFSVIGITHGQGDGSTTFNLPDYRGRFLRGVDGSAGLDPDKASRTAMAAGGNTGNAVGSVQGDQFAAHTHAQTAGFVWTGGGAGFGDLDTGGAGGEDWGPTGATAQVTGPNGGNETRPENAYVNFIIKI